MFNKSIIQAAAVGLVGMNTSVHQFYKYLQNHKTSSSGYWINALQGADFGTIEASQPSTVQNIDLIVGERYKIRAAGGDFTNVGASDNSVGTTFIATGTTPTSWSDTYLELQSCNKYLDDIYNEEITNVISRFIANSKAYLKQNTLLSNHSVIGGVADMSKKVTKDGRFVGFVLNPHEGNNIINLITRIGFLADAADSGLKLYLYETSQQDAIATFDFDYTTPLSQQWKDVQNFIVKYDNTRAIKTGQGSNVTSSSRNGFGDITAGGTTVVTFNPAFVDAAYSLNIDLFDISGVKVTGTVTNRTKDGFSVYCAVQSRFDYTAVRSEINTYATSNYDGGIGQKYLLGYFEDDLTANAIEMEFNQSLKNFSIFGKFMAVFPVEIPSDKLNGYKLPSNILGLGSYISQKTHGIYFKFTANCEYTNMIEDNIEIFAEVLQYSIALRILQDAVASVGDGVHNPTKDAAIPEWRKLISKYSGVLNGGYINVGDYSKYEKGLLQLLTLDFSNIDPVCFKHDPNEFTVGNLM